MADNSSGAVHMIDALTELIPTLLVVLAFLYALYLIGELWVVLMAFLKGIFTKKATGRKGNSYDDKVIHNDMGEVGGEE